MSSLASLLEQVKQLDETERLELIVQIGLMMKHEKQLSEQEELMSEKEQAGMMALLDSVSKLVPENLPPVSNRDHDKYLYSQP